jgi:hypothetical protein
VYGYLTGSKDAYAAERAVGQALAKIFPGIREVASENRKCVNGRVPAHLAQEYGFVQFLDLGCGMPEEPLLHESVQAVASWARVVYVDADETVLSHARRRYSFRPGLAVVGADVTDIDGLLHHPELRQVLDPDQPVVAVAGALLHFIPDDLVTRMVDDLAAGLAAGSVLAWSHVTHDGVPDEETAAAKEVYEQHVSHIYVRSKEEILALLGDRPTIAGPCRTYELLPEHPDDVELARDVPGAPHFYTGILELSPDPLRGTTVLPRGGAAAL